MSDFLSPQRDTRLQDEIDRLKGELEEARAEQTVIKLDYKHSTDAQMLYKAARQEAASEILHIISMETIDRPFEQSQAAEIIKDKFKLEG